MMLRKVASAAFIAALLSSSALAQPVPGGGGGGGGGGGTGDVTGPGSSTSGNFPSFNGTGGKTLQDSAYSPSSFAPAGAVTIVTGSNPTTNAASWLAFTQYTIGGSGRTITLPASSGLSANGGLDIDANTNSVTLTATSPDTITWAGSTTGAGGSVTLPAGALYRVSTDAAGKIYVSGRQAQGNGAKVQLSTGTTTTNNCVKFDANGNTVDAGTACGGSSASNSNWQASNWYPSIPQADSAGVNISTTVTEWVPVYFDRSVTIGNLGVRITTSSAAGNIQLSVYASGTNGLPTGSALCTTASISTGSTGSFSSACSAAISGPARVWLGMQVDNATALVLSATRSPANAIIGASSQVNLSGSTTNGGTEYKTTGGTFGTWPTNPTISQAGTTAAVVPNIQFSLTSVP